ncbi:MAG: globin [Caulobacter sp.]|nr:globin [Caulobacter sp.]
MTDALTASLEQVVERCGDPTALVYERLFAQQPEMEALFIGDVTGQARGHMLMMALETLTDLAEGKAWAGNMIRAERVNHDQLGVPDAVFATFFAVVHETFRAVCDEAWTGEMEAAWTTVLATADAA